MSLVMVMQIFVVVKFLIAIAVELTSINVACSILTLVVIASRTSSPWSDTIPSSYVITFTSENLRV